MSVGVTEPKSEPVGPAFTSKRSSVFAERVRDRGRLVGRLRLVPCPLRVALLQLGDRAFVACSARPRGRRKLRA